MIGSIESGVVAVSFSMPKKKKAAVTAAPLAGAPVEQDVPARMKALRIALGYPTVPAFTAFLRIEPKRWYNVEAGFPLSKDLAILLVQRIPGLTTDYVWFGRSGGLPIELARRLGVFDPPQESA